MHLRLLYCALLVLLASACTPSNPIQPVRLPAGPSSQLPYLTEDGDGGLYLSWTESRGDGETELRYARFDGQQWSEAMPVASGTDWFVNWADYPSITASPEGPLAVHWLHKLPGGPYAYEVNVATLAGDSIQVLTPHNDGTATEHGFVSMVPWTSDSVLAVWLDGRQTAGRSDEQYSDLSRAMTLRSGVIGQDGGVGRRAEIDPSVCDCCQTSLARLEEGAIAAYRDRSEGEIRDIYVSRYRGGSWEEPVRVHADNWQIGGCPVNGPVVRVRDEEVLVAWFTGADGQYRVMAAFSTDGGASFQEPVTVSDDRPLGRVDAVFTGPGSAVVSWIERSSDSTAAVQIREVSRNNSSAGTATTLTPISPDRASGFPQLALLKGRLYLAWTDIGEPQQVRMASLSLQQVLQ